MVKNLTISVAGVSFLFAPALCMGGVITHGCDCAGQIACHCRADCNHESGCGHEGGCADDPCSVCVVRPERQRNDSVTVVPPAVSTTIIFIAVTQPPIPAERTDSYERPGGKNLPLAPSDVPLLI